MTLADSIRSEIQRHYDSSDEPLMLSALGKLLRMAQVWPVDGERRSLSSVVEELGNGYGVLRDSAMPSFAVVKAPEKEDVAKRAIKMRQQAAFLESVPRGALLAFVVRAGDDERVFLSKSHPFRYAINPDNPDDFFPVPEEYRIPGLYVDRVKELASGQISELSRKIRDWAAAHSFPLERFAEVQAVGTEEKAASYTRRQIAGSPRSTNALERLVAAQPQDLANRLVIPADIALYLSRLD